MQSHNPTRKEKQFLVFILALMFGIAIIARALQINMLVFNAWVTAHEPQILLAFLPLGLYFTLDKERLSKE